ncbi:MAG: hypothetical protein RL033_525 [Pseudomonadota bacterium]
MATSPLEHEELRHIERTLDVGDTAGAAQLLARFANSRAHEVAITFLATRLLFQRGRIDMAGAADRVSALLSRSGPFLEAEDWLAELEGRTEPSALPEASAVVAEVLSPAAEVEAEVEADEQTSPSHPPPSRAPSVPRPSHPFFDQLGDDEDEEVTPAEPLASRRQEADRPEAQRHEAVRPPARDDEDGSEPPPRPAAAIASVFPPGLEPTSPALPAARKASTPPARGTYKAFDSLRAKERLASHAGRYRASSYPDELRTETVPGANRRATGDGAKGGAVSAEDVRRAVLGCWELVLSGRLDEARALIPEEPSPPSLDPESRVALARVLLETGAAERAGAEATIALNAAPDLAEARLMFVWCAVRHARQRDDAWSLDRAEVLLKASLGPAPEAGLVLALQACVEARIGTPAVALRLAQRALRSNAESVDGLAALAEAAALCGEEPRAEAALERLFGLSEAAAEQLTPRLRRLGVGEQGPTSSASVWLPLEHTLSSGARDVALEGLESMAGDKLAELALSRPQDREAAGRAVSHFLTLAPIFRHFGCYDLSLASLERLETALGLLYGTGPRPLDVPNASATLWRISGLYLGETLRRAAGGRWGEQQELEDAVLEILGQEVLPFQVVRHRIAHGRHATLATALESVLAGLPGRSSSGKAASWEGAQEVAPPLPWAEAWPTLEDLPRLGRALGHSVVAVYCAGLGVAALDRTSKTLPALDQYLELLVPAQQPLPASSSWARWLAGFLGAYLGEVLCKELGGVWVRGDGREQNAAAIQVAGRRISPVALVFDTVTGGTRTSLENCAGELRKMLRHSDIPRA